MRIRPNVVALFFFICCLLLGTYLWNNYQSDAPREQALLIYLLSIIGGVGLMALLASLFDFSSKTTDTDEV